MSNSGIVQYIIVRSDLKSTLNWPLGAIIAQCCHAATAVMHQNYDDDETKEYLKDMDNMHKVVLQVSATERGVEKYDIYLNGIHISGEERR